MRRQIWNSVEKRNIIKDFLVAWNPQNPQREYEAYKLNVKEVQVHDPKSQKEGLEEETRVRRTWTT